MIPLIVEGKPIGVLTFIFTGNHSFSEEERAFILTISHHCALALNRARLLEAERQASKRLRLLAKIGDLLPATIEFDAILEKAVTIAIPEFADSCSLHLLTDDKDTPTKHVVARTTQVEIARLNRFNQKHPIDINTAHIVGLVIRSGKPMFIPEITDDQIDRSSLDSKSKSMIKQIGIHSVITVPLIARDKTLGVLTFMLGDSGRLYEQADMRCRSASRCADRNFA